MENFQLKEYRFFDPEPNVRKIAYELYWHIKEMPIISPHGHFVLQLLFVIKPFLIRTN